MTVSLVNAPIFRHVNSIAIAHRYSVNPRYQHTSRFGNPHTHKNESMSIFSPNL